MKLLMGIVAIVGYGLVGLAAFMDFFWWLRFPG